MKKVIIEYRKKPLLKVLDWLLYIIGYALILITISLLFKETVYIDNSYFGLWAFLAAIIIYVLNKTIKPVLVWLTLPITALTLGLFYPVVNVIILNITSFVLGSHFKLQGFIMSVFVAILISIMNIIFNKLVMEPITGGKNE